MPSGLLTNQLVQLQKLARALKFWIQKREIILSKQRKTKAMISLRGCIVDLCLCCCFFAYLLCEIKACKHTYNRGNVDIKIKVTSGSIETCRKKNH